MTDFSEALTERLTRYCAVDSQSDEASASQPSTAIQWDMLHLLRDELQAMGASDVRVMDYGSVLATVPATAEGAPVIGFLAHVDTAPAFNATGVKPVVHREWNGGPITYPDNADLVLDPADWPYLAGKAGEDIITASGTTLLGADDKSGVAVIMTMAEHLLRNPSIAHGELRLAFTTDEEIGRGVPDDLPRPSITPPEVAQRLRTFLQHG